MLNFIRADLYRLSRSKSFWITEGIILLLVILSVVSNGSVGVTLGIVRKQQAALQKSLAFWRSRPVCLPCCCITPCHW